MIYENNKLSKKVKDLTLIFIYGDTILSYDVFVGAGIAQWYSAGLRAG
jgi:hypothetical protein